MIRTNLSTRPFYNERAVHAWLLLVAALVIAASVFNVTRLLRYSGSNTQQETAASQDGRPSQEGTADPRGNGKPRRRRRKPKAPAAAEPARCAEEGAKVEPA